MNIIMIGKCTEKGVFRAVSVEAVAASTQPNATRNETQIK